MGPHLFDSAVQTSLLYGQGWVQVGQLLLAFALSSIIGIERQWKDKNAGLRIYSAVGTSAALLTLVGKYGFMDVIMSGQLVADPSRVAAQIVTGVGFLGAGLIITHRGAVSGLTTAATMWETAAIGIAVGAGLWLLAVAITVLHFASMLVYAAVAKRMSSESPEP